MPLYPEPEWCIFRMSPLWVLYRSMTSWFPPFAFVELVAPYNKKNITRWLEDMNFMFSWQEQYLTRSLHSLVRYCPCHSNIKFISSRHRVISSIYLFLGCSRLFFQGNDKIESYKLAEVQFCMNWICDEKSFKFIIYMLRRLSFIRSIKVTLSSVNLKANNWQKLNFVWTGFVLREATVFTCNVLYSMAGF